MSTGNGEEVEFKEVGGKVEGGRREVNREFLGETVRKEPAWQYLRFFLHTRNS